MSSHAKQTILILLNDVVPHALPESELFIRVNARHGRPLGVVEFSEHLAWLFDEQLIKKMSGRFESKEARWLITDAGKAELER